ASRRDAGDAGTSSRSGDAAHGSPPPQSTHGFKLDATLGGSRPMISLRAFRMSCMAAAALLTVPLLAGEPYLVRDINPKPGAPASSQPQDLITVGSSVFVV